MAFSRTALPSVPFNPTAPPIPATGLTMKPRVFVARLFWGTVNLNSLNIIGLKKQKEKHVYLSGYFLHNSHLICKSTNLQQKCQH
jgi:hypothetical protein